MMHLLKEGLLPNLVRLSLFFSRVYFGHGSSSDPRGQNFG